MSTLITKIKSASSREEIRALFAQETIDVQQIMLSSVIDMLNKEIECDIHTGNIDVAIFKMSQVVMYEDEKHVVERVMLKQSVLVR